MKEKIYYTLLFIVGIAINGCNDYLDTVPDNRAVIDNAEAIKELLVSAYPSASYFPFCEIMSDNAQDKGIVRGQGRNQDIAAYEWSEIQEINQDTPTYYWNACYSAIATANQAIESINEIGAESPEMQPVLGEALICRAYAGYMLASIFCNAYNPETANSDMGIPYPKTPGKVVFGKFERGTLEETFKNIRQDIENGIDLIQNTYNAPKYHFTKEAASAFASRFYQTVGEWDKVVTYSTQALGENPEVVLRGWNNPNTYVVYTFDELKDAYTSSAENANILLISTTSWWGRRCTGNRFGLTTQLQDKLFRYNNPLGVLYGFRVFGSDTHRNVPKIKEYFKYSSLNATTGRGYVMNPVFTAEEALLNRAEAYLMLGKTDLAINDINIWLSKRIRNYTGLESQIITVDIINNFYTTDKIPSFNTFYQIEQDKLPIIQCILEMRRTEFMHEGLRWFDIKRMGISIDHIRKEGSNDEETVLTLSWDDPRKAIQIPQDAQSFGIKANPR